MTRRDVFTEDELRQMIADAIERARSTTREKMCDEAISDLVIRRYVKRGSRVIEVSGPPPMETR